MPDVPSSVLSDWAFYVASGFSTVVSIIGVGAFTHLKLENKSLRDEIEQCKNNLAAEIKNHNSLVITRLDKMDEKMISINQCKSNQDLFIEKLRSINEAQTLRHKTIEEKLDIIFEKIN